MRAHAMPVTYLPPLTHRLAEWVRAAWRVFCTDGSAAECLRRLPAERTCVVILDAIQAYESLFSWRAQAALEDLATVARRRRIPVVATQWARTSRDADDGIDRIGHWSMYVPPGQTDVLPAVAAAATHIVPVRHTNAFVHEEFRQLVEHAEYIVLAGSWTESCVVNTARAAVDAGKVVHVMRTGCAGHWPGSWLALVTMSLFYASTILR